MRRPPVDFERFFEPRAVAVVGASDTEDGVAAMNTRMLRSWLEPRAIPLRPVNPRRRTVGGLPCWPSLLDVPGDVDVAVVLVSADAAESAVLQAIERKIAFAVLFGAGFAESGPEGAARQERVVAAVASSDLRLLGPNTTLNAFQPFRTDLPGRAIALVTQSGHQGRPLYQAQEIGVRVSHWAPTGNEADLDAADFVRWLADREEVGAIAAYLEGFADGPAFLEAVDHAAARGIPVVVVKVGRSEVGRSWAQSHSGHLAGADAVTDAALRQHGVIRVDGLDELQDTAMLLARAPAPRTDGVAVYSISGGTGAHVADLACAAGLHLPELAPATQEALHRWIAPYLRVSNPVDSGGHPSGDERGPLILDAILDDPSVGILIVPFAGSFPPISERFAADVVAAAARHPETPVCAVWGSPAGTEEAYRDILLPSGVPVFRTVRNCLSAVQAYVAWHAFPGRGTDPAGLVASTPVPGGVATRRAGLGGSGARSERESKQLLAAYGIPVTEDRLVAHAEGAVAAWRACGRPVVLKGCGDGIAHKTDLGLVRVGADSEVDVRAAHAEVVASAEAAGAELDGVLVCPLETGGVEVILGVVRDEVFGPTVMVGLGGISVEIYRDVAFRVPPFDRAEARRMVEELRGLPLLQGARGRPAADVDALLDAVVAVQRLAVELGDELLELDVNPLLVRPDGVVALDALAVAPG